MIKAWNCHMATKFIASWTLCLDESVSMWTIKWTCPGWMHVLRKPHSMGNECHAIFCSLSGIMFEIELVEEKDAPKDGPA